MEIEIDLRFTDIIDFLYILAGFSVLVSGYSLPMSPRRVA
jgi:hypothetical protein